jgi:hypothetical protein
MSRVVTSKMLMLHHRRHMSHVSSSMRARSRTPTNFCVHGWGRAPARRIANKLTSAANLLRAALAMQQARRGV